MKYTICIQGSTKLDDANINRHWRVYFRHHHLLHRRRFLPERDIPKTRHKSQLKRYPSPPLLPRRRKSQLQIQPPTPVIQKSLGVRHIPSPITRYLAKSIRTTIHQIYRPLPPNSEECNLMKFLILRVPAKKDPLINRAHIKL